MNLSLTPELVYASAGGLVTVLTGIVGISWKLARKLERKKNYNGNGELRDSRDYSALIDKLTENTTTKTEHKDCKEDRKNIESQLFEGQKFLSKTMETNRKEAREDKTEVTVNLSNLANETKSGFEIIHNRISDSQKTILKEIKTINKK